MVRVKFVLIQANGLPGSTYTFLEYNVLNEIKKISTKTKTDVRNTLLERVLV